MRTTSTERVYVALLDEDVAVWRPTDAQRLPDGTYRLLPTADYDAAIERWEFPPGSRVVCERRSFASGEALAAIRQAEPRRQIA